MLKRYAELELRGALSRKEDYTEACKELALLLRGSYSKAPKALQAVLFEDTIAAFHILSQVATNRALSAANRLLQAAEAALPKQKRGIAVTEFKHAAVAARRRSKDYHRETEPEQLPHDVLVNIFQRLDARSLVSASSVSRWWSLAARENCLWKMQYIRHFGDGLQTGIIEKHNMDESLNPVKLEMDQNTDWYQAFKNRCKGDSSQLFISNRAFCKTCKSPIWLRSHCAERGDDTVQGSHQHIPKPMIPAKVLHYLLGESMVSSSSSSDSDSEGELFAAKFSRLWARPRFAYEAFDAL